MRRFGYHRASTLREALDLKAEFGARGLLIAGGTDLLVALRKQSRSLPSVEVIDITPVRELAGISAGDRAEDDKGAGIRLGPLVTFSEIESNPLLGKSAPLLAEASAEVGSPQTRNRGTIGGNICNASPCADAVPPLVVLGAELTLRSVRGAREVLLEESILSPYKTVLAADEILTDIRFAPLPGAGEGGGCAFVKLGRRNALSISRMSVAVIVGTGDGDAMSGVRIAAGSVTPTVRRFPEVEALLEGKVPTAELFAAAGEALAAEMIRVSGRRWSTPYKEPVVAVLLRRALAGAMGAG